MSVPSPSDPHAKGVEGRGGVPVAATVAALDAMGIDDTWVVAAELRAAHKAGVARTEIKQPLLARFNPAFRNLILGRIGEELFEKQCLAPLTKLGFRVVDERPLRNKLDFVLEYHGARLPINVKVVGTRFLQARQYVGLEPDDAVPLKLAAVMDGAKDEPDLIFVQLIEHGLRQRVDAYMSQLSGNEAVVWQLLSVYGGEGAKTAQDQYVDALFAKGSLHAKSLVALSAGIGGFRAISADEALTIHKLFPKRTPQMGGHFLMNGQPQVHVSASTEMTPWKDVAGHLRTVGVAGVVRQIRGGGLHRTDPGMDLAA